MQFDHTKWSVVVIKSDCVMDSFAGFSNPGWQQLATLEPLLERTCQIIIYSKIFKGIAKATSNISPRSPATKSKI